MTTATTKLVREELDLFELIGLAILNTLYYALTGLVVVLWWAILFPMLSLPVLASAVFGWRMGWPVGLALAGVSVAGIMLWRWRWPRMFERSVSRRARFRFLAWWRYRRQWTTRIEACGLVMEYGNVTGYPVAPEIHIGDITDHVVVRMLPGQSPFEWEGCADRLAFAFGARDCWVWFAGPGLVELVFWHWDSSSVAVLDDGDEGAAA